MLVSMVKAKYYLVVSQLEGSTVANGGKGGLQGGQRMIIQEH